MYNYFIERKAKNMVTSRQIREVLLESGDVPREELVDSGVIGVLMAFVDEKALQKWYDNRRANLDSQRVCVYCYGTWDSETMVCPTCEEYDGMVDYKTAMADGTLKM